MTEKPTGGPAFPTIKWDAPQGMSLRDWFAGQALMGLIAGRNYDMSTPHVVDRAGDAYTIADAMIAEREK
jgi:hypothetical protein